MPPIINGKTPRTKRKVGLIWGSLLTLGLLGCAAKIPQEPLPIPQSSPDTFSYENIALTQTGRDGQLQWKITATLAQYAPDRTTAALTSVTGEFFDSTGDPIRIIAAAGQVQVLERQVSLIGEIQAEYPRQGLLLKAQELQWIPDQHQLIASDKIRIQFRDPENPQRQVEVSGSQVVWDTQNHLLRITRTEEPVQLVSTDPPLTLTANQVQWNLPSDTVQAQGSVTLVGQPNRQTLRETITLRGSTLTLTPKLVTLTGDTYARTQHGGELWSQELRWPFGKPMVYASGGVRYQQPGQALSVSGREAVVNWQTQTARISGSTTTTRIF